MCSASYPKIESSSALKKAWKIRDITGPDKHVEVYEIFGYVENLEKQ